MYDRNNDSERVSVQQKIDLAIVGGPALRNDAMNKYTNVQTGDSETQKLVPKCFHLNSKDGKLFRQKYEEKAVIVTKVTTYQLKIVSSMDDLMVLLKKSPTFVDPTDQFKQRKLFADFIARFSRNYIYEIDRIIEEIQFYQVDHYSYFERSTNHFIGKVCNLFAVIMRALQIYQKQLARMNNENSEKLLRLTELIVVGINVSVELKIFDEDDLLIKVLLDKSEEFIALLRHIMFRESPTENQPVTKPSIMALTKDTYIPTTNRYGMYASQSKKVKPTKSMMTVTKTNRNGKGSTNGNQHRRGQHTGEIQRMFEAQVCSGESSIPGTVQTIRSDFNSGCSSSNNTCNTDGTLNIINNPVVSQCGNNVSNNKRNTITANCDTTNMLYRREVSSASSINIENDHKIMTMLRRTGCLTLPQYQMRMLNGYNECGDIGEKIQFSRNVQHLHVKCHHDNETDKDDRPAETIAKTDVAVETKDFPTDKPSPNSTLRRIFNRTNNIIDQTRTELIDAGNSFIATYVKDFLEAELNF